LEAGAGGGIYGGVTANGCVLVGNSAMNSGGGIYGGGTVTNCTLIGNAAELGGGMDGGGNLISSTVSGNRAAISGGGIEGLSLGVRNTIIAGNVAGHSGDDIDGIHSLGYNLIGNTQGGSGFDPTNLLDVDPLLDSLHDNGGPTSTMALRPGSPALNAGDPSELGVPDQRGVTRSGGVNIGAYQASATAFLVGAPDAVTAGVPFDVTVTAVDPFSQVAVGYNGTVTFATTDPDPKVVLPADYMFTPGDAGVHTFTDSGLGEVTLVTLGDQTLFVTDTADSTIAGDAIITVDSTAPAGATPLLGQPAEPARLQASASLVRPKVQSESHRPEVGDNYTQGSAATLESQLGDTLFGQLLVSDAATLDGTLTVAR
jgi:parallel beta-helix repeat protein